MGTPCRPEKYESFMALKIRETLAEAIVAWIDKKKIATATIALLYPSVRSGDIQKLRRGEPFGFNMLCSIAEALGLRDKFEVNP